MQDLTEIEQQRLANQAVNRLRLHADGLCGCGVPCACTRGEPCGCELKQLKQIQQKEQAKAEAREAKASRRVLALENQRQQPPRVAKAAAVHLAREQQKEDAPMAAPRNKSSMAKPVNPAVNPAAGAAAMAERPADWITLLKRLVADEMYMYVKPSCR